MTIIPARAARRRQAARPPVAPWYRQVALLQFACALAWLVYLVIYAEVLLRPTPAAGSVWWCMPGMSGHGPSRLAPSGWLAMWSLMLLAMTLPATLPAAQHVAANSFSRKRTRAVGIFSAVYLGTWVAFGLAADALLALLGRRHTDWLFALALAGAAAYELTPFKRRALNRCHRTLALPPSGVRGIVSVARFGWLHASGCLASCWLGMLAMLLAPSAQPFVMATMTTAMTYERLTRRPLTSVRRVATGYGALAVTFLLAGA